MIEEFERCYRAIRRRSVRFDGWFYAGVTSTGIYCRPSCPAVTPKRPNARSPKSAASAQANGFRRYKRCRRSGAVPVSPEWNVRAYLGVRRAVERFGRPGAPALVTRLAEGWSPWRAYATQYLWASLEGDAATVKERPRGRGVVA